MNAKRKLGTAPDTDAPCLVIFVSRFTRLLHRTTIVASGGSWRTNDRSWRTICWAAASTSPMSLRCRTHRTPKVRYELHINCMSFCFVSCNFIFIPTNIIIFYKNITRKSEGNKKFYDTYILGNILGITLNTFSRMIRQT